MWVRLLSGWVAAGSREPTARFEVDPGPVQRLTLDSGVSGPVSRAELGLLEALAIVRCQTPDMAEARASGRWSDVSLPAALTQGRVTQIRVRPARRSYAYLADGSEISVS
jgi:hypothetical protein